MLRNLLTLFLIAMLPALATAQSTTTQASEPQKPPPPRPALDWPDPGYSGHLDIITLASPGVRHHCHVSDLTADAITCRPGHHQPPTIFQRSQILALIFPSWSGISFNFLWGIPLVVVAILLVVIVL